MLKVGTFEMKSEISEYTLFEFEQISNTLNDESLDYIDKYLKIFEILNVPEEIVDELDDTEFFNIIKSFNQETPSQELTKEIEVNGYTYTAYEGDTFKLKLKDLAIIENLIKKSGKMNATEIIAVLFKRNDLTKKEHYEPAHIKYKKELFKDIPVSLVFPYFVYLGEKLVKKITAMTDQNG